MNRLSVLPIALVLCLGCGEPADPNAGMAATDISVAKVGTDGKQMVKLSEFKGKVVLIDFWATWCGPCKAIIPTIEDRYKKYKDQGFEVISVSMEPESTLVAYQQKDKPPYPLYRDPTGLANGLYSVTEIPRQVLVDREGKVAKDIIGADAVGLGEAIDRAMSD